MATAPFRTRWFWLALGLAMLAVTTVLLYPSWFNIIDRERLQVSTAILEGAVVMAMLGIAVHLVVQALVQPNPAGWSWGDAMTVQGRRRAAVLAAAVVTVGCLLPLGSLHEDGAWLPQTGLLMAGMGAIALVAWAIAWSVARRARAAGAGAL